MTSTLIDLPLPWQDILTVMYDSYHHLRLHS
jgi:hypothetical protein